MNILQMSPPSGNYWLHTIVLEILRKKKLPVKSFIRNQPVYDRVRDLELTFEGQAAVDMIDIEDDGCYYRVSSVIRERIDDIKKYSASTSLACTDSSLCITSFEVCVYCS